MKKVILLSAFFSITPFIVISISFILLSGSLRNGGLFANIGANPKVAFAALPVASGTLRSQIKSGDARVLVVTNFFRKYKSNLLLFADDVVSAADKYGLDYRLIPAIAMQESGGCKHAPTGSHNCWGFGIYGKKVTKFDSYEQAIDTVTKTLATKYKANGLETPEQIMTKYTPGSNGSWAISVNHFMNQLSTDL